MTTYKFSEIGRWRDKVERRMETAVRKIAIDVFTRVILRTPVLSGRARGNWQVAIGNLPTGTLELDDKDGSITIGKVEAETLGLKAGESIYLVNNLPYIYRLETGYSDQAPAGMVGITVQEFEPLVAAIARELNR